MKDKMFSRLKRLFVIVLAVVVGMSLLSCAALNRPESDNPDHEKNEPGKKIPLPPTIKDFDSDSE